MNVIRFGVFEAHLSSGELFKSGKRVRLQQQPFDVLRTLIARPGEVVTRDDLRKALWPDDVTVDFDQSLNKSVTKLRDALGDLAASPRFIETLPKRGYRFIADVHSADPADPTVAAEAEHRPLNHRLRWIPVGVWLSAAAAAAMVVTIATLAITATSDSAKPLEAGAEKSRDVDSAATRTPIFAARDAYDLGRATLTRRSEESLKLSLEHFTRAVALSPRFAAAHVGLAESWALLASYGATDPRQAMPRARDAANRALLLDPNLARAHASLGRTAMTFDWDWRTAGWHFRRAIALEPGDATTHQWYAYYFSATGRHQEAIDEARRAIVAEPLSLSANTALGYVLYLARRHDEAATQLTRTLTIDPDFAQARRDLALVHLQHGRGPAAIAELRRVATLNEGSTAAQAELAYGYAVTGDHAAARRLLAHLERERATRYVPPDGLAMVHGALGDVDEAVGWLHRALTMRVATLAHLGVEPVWDELRRDARVAEMVRTVGATAVE